MLSITLTTLGTVWWIEIYDEMEEKSLSDLKNQIETFLLSVNDRFSRFKSDSLVGQLNQNREIFSQDKELFELITLGQNFYRDTFGHFNFLLGNHLEASGYDATYSFASKDKPSTIANPLNDIVISDSGITLKDGGIDLGGFGKGWAIDKMAEIIKNYGVVGFLINGGGDIYATEQNGQPIKIYLEHPIEKDTYLATVLIHHQGFASSSPHKRKWTQNGTNHTHIVGHKDGRDASFVIAPTAVVADMIATTVLLASYEEQQTINETYQAKVANFSLATNTLSYLKDYPLELL